MAKPRTPEYCPVCGDDVPRGALACPKCGADHRSGWRDDADEADFDDGFDHDSFVREEFGKTPAKPAHLSFFWWVAAIAVTAAVVILVLHGRF